MKVTLAAPSDVKPQSHLPSDFSICIIFCGGFPGGSDDKRICLQCRKCGLDPWFGKIPWRREWQLTPVFLPGKSHGQGSLVGYSSLGHKRVEHGWVTKQKQKVFSFACLVNFWKREASGTHFRTQPNVTKIDAQICCVLTGFNFHVI